ncbi:MAG: competence/damage-inducible protein A [Acidimicrobiia bacterium]|nr:competence/damage-inducible protein A [Acidimicrobiia bacterium]
MIVEVIAVGTELLLGQIINTNLAHIGSRIADLGLDAHYQQTVGDNLDRMDTAITTALGRADAVIITGGIGPTQDDITREAICAATGRPMAFSDEYARALRERYATWGREMPESNLRQAEYPEGAELLPNPKGTAPGLALEHDGKLIFALPGVPPEMYLLLDDYVLPRIKAKAGIDEVLVSRVIRTWGKGESAVAEMLGDLYEASTNPSMAFLASNGEIKVRLTAKAPTAAEAETLIAPVQAEVEDRLGSLVFGADDDTIETILIDLAKERGWTVGTAESATGGLLAGRLTAAPGSSEVFRGSIVAYAPDLKRDLLGVDDVTIAAGVVSEKTALAMAQGARERLDVDVAVSVTGFAGPSGETPGTMIVAVATPEGARAQTLRLPGDRERVRTYTVTAGMHLLRLGLTGDWWGS